MFKSTILTHQSEHFSQLTGVGKPLCAYNLRREIASETLLLTRLHYLRGFRSVHAAAATIASTEHENLVSNKDKLNMSPSSKQLQSR